MSVNPLRELAEHSRSIRVVVIGAGIAGLVAAWECAKVGMQVVLLEASAGAGGVLGQAEVAGVTLDVGPDSFAPSVAALARELGLEPTPIAEDSVWISGLSVGAVPLPDATLAGIPENAWDESVRRIIGWGGAWRAYLDRIRPPLTIGQQRSLGALVRSRMGTTVHDRMVAPLAVGRFGVGPDEVDVEALAPGLGAGLTRTGSLGAAVATQRGTEPALQGVPGGLGMLVAAITDRLAELGAELRCGARVREITPGEHWRIVLEDDPAEALTADAVIVATDEAAARGLLQNLGEIAPAPGRTADDPAVDPAVEVITLVVQSPALSSHPHGAATYPIPGTSTARSVLDATARWGWLRAEVRDRLGPDIHVLRVTIPASALADSDDRDAYSLALAEASAMLGSPLADTNLRGAHRASFTLTRPASVLGHADAAAETRAALAEHPRLAVVGSWLAGSGLAQTIPDAVAHADHIRHETLWGEPADAGNGIYD